MARDLKPQVVDKIRVRMSYDWIEIMLDRNQKTFFADFYGEKIEGKTFEEVRNKVRIAADNAVQLEWIPIIEIEVDDPNRWSWNKNGDERQSFFKVTIDRYYVAKTPQKGWIRTNWENKKEDRLKYYKPVYFGDHDYDSVVFPCHHGLEHWMPYTEELWTGLNELLNSIVRARDKLVELVKDERSIKQIEGVGASILGRLLMPGGADGNKT